VELKEPREPEELKEQQEPRNSWTAESRTSGTTSLIPRKEELSTHESAQTTLAHACPTSMPLDDVLGMYSIPVDERAST